MFDSVLVGTSVAVNGVKLVLLVDKVGIMVAVLFLVYYGYFLLSVQHSFGHNGYLTLRLASFRRRKRLEL